LKSNSGYAVEDSQAYWKKLHPLFLPQTIGSAVKFSAALYQLVSSKRAKVNLEID
jgi:hypothetical protein